MSHEVDYLTHIRRWAAEYSDLSVVREVLAEQLQSRPAALKVWAGRHRRLSTFQFRMSRLNSGELVPRSMWAPGPRDVEVRSSSMSLGTSSMEFRGTRHVGHSERAYVAFTEGFEYVTIYVAEGVN